MYATLATLHYTKPLYILYSKLHWQHYTRSTTLPHTPYVTLAVLNDTTLHITTLVTLNWKGIETSLATLVCTKLHSLHYTCTHWLILLCYNITVFYTVHLMLPVWSISHLSQSFSPTMPGPLLLVFTEPALIVVASHTKTKSALHFINIPFCVWTMWWLEEGSGLKSCRSHRSANLARPLTTT